MSRYEIVETRYSWQCGCSSTGFDVMPGSPDMEITRCVHMDRDCPSHAFAKRIVNDIDEAVCKAICESLGHAA